MANDSSKSSSPDSHDDHHGVGHVVPIRYLVLNGIALLILTVITVAAAQIDFTQWDIYELNVIGAITIATVKAVLVCLFFMHLYWDRRFNSFVLVSSIAFVGLFMALAMLDTSEYADDKVRGDSETIQRLLDEARTERGSAD